MNMVLLNVSGISNAQMKTSIKNALDKLDGVQTVDIDKTLGQIKIGYNDNATETQIKDCITDAGFSVS